MRVFVRGYNSYEMLRTFSCEVSGETNRMRCRDHFLVEVEGCQRLAIADIPQPPGPSAGIAQRAVRAK